jgi:hypothetical protein
MFHSANETADTGSPREKVAEHIRIAVRTARAERDNATADELIAILEFMDLAASPHALAVAGQIQPTLQ